MSVKKLAEINPLILFEFAFYSLYEVKMKLNMIFYSFIHFHGKYNVVLKIQPL